MEATDQSAEEFCIARQTHAAELFGPSILSVVGTFDTDRRVD